MQCQLPNYSEPPSLTPPQCRGILGSCILLQCSLPHWSQCLKLRRNQCNCRYEGPITAKCDQSLSLSPFKKIREAFPLFPCEGTCNIIQNDLWAEGCLSLSRPILRLPSTDFPSHWWAYSQFTPRCIHCVCRNPSLLTQLSGSQPSTVHGATSSPPDSLGSFCPFGIFFHPLPTTSAPSLGAEGGEQDTGLPH